jgi:DNA-binding transcriptional MerR regulator
MEYRVEELAAASGVNVDTLRFYQARGLLPHPARRGRVALYGDAHLERLRRIRELRREGFSLAQIQRLLAQAPGAEASDRLLEALRQSVGARTLSRAELAAEAGVPEPLVRAVEATGLLQPVQLAGEERFHEADVELARAGLAILGAGFPLDELLAQAQRHGRNVEALCDAAIELFDRHVRKRGPAAGDPEAIAESFRRLLPQVTRAVALHFQRTLVQRALRRLEDKRENEALAQALAATGAGRLAVDVAWRS